MQAEKLFSRRSWLTAQPEFIMPIKGNYTGKVLLLILLVSLVKLVPGFLVNLGNDEAYYWLYSLKLQWNYFDHPPLVAIWVRIFTLNLLLEDFEGFIRLGSIVAAGFSTWFIFKATSILYSQRAGWFAAILYNTSFYSAIVAGLFIMPDSPQMFFWTFCMWMLARLQSKNSDWKTWIMFGIAAGLCIMSKVHGIFLLAGLAGYTIVFKKEWLKNPWFFIALAIAAVIASPILIWNIYNDFATYQLHSKRVIFDDDTVNHRSFINELLGQFLFNNPFNVILTVMSMTVGLKYIKPNLRMLSLYAFIGLPLILILLVVSVSKPIFPHWSGPAYVSLIPVTAVFLCRSKEKIFPGWKIWTLASLFVFITGWFSLMNLYPGTWGNKEGTEKGKGDISLDRYGWRKAGVEFSSYFKQEVREGKIPANTPLVCSKWWGAHIEFYFCRPAGTTMLGLGSMKPIGHYLWLNSDRRETVQAQRAFCIIPSDEYYDVKEKFSEYYHQSEHVKTISTTRGNKIIRHFYVYSLTGLKKAIPVFGE